MNVIGSKVFVWLEGIGPIPAKVDTGADSSSVWASDIRVEHGELSFVLFDQSSEFYTGERIHRKHFSTINVKNSTGHTEKRYLTKLSIKIQNRTIRARFTLSDRSHNQFPILIGRHTLHKKFIVDVSQTEIPHHIPQSEIKQGNSK